MVNSTGISLETRLDEFIKDKEFQRKFAKLQSLMYDIAYSKGWHNPSKSFGEQILMAHSELSEVVEAFRTTDTDIVDIGIINIGETKVNPENDIVGLDGELSRALEHIPNDVKPEGVTVEIADCIIRLMDTAEFLCVDLIMSLLIKARFNLTRPERHGGKKL